MRTTGFRSALLVTFLWSLSACDLPSDVEYPPLDIRGQYDFVWSLSYFDPAVSTSQQWGTGGSCPGFLSITRQKSRSFRGTAHADSSAHCRAATFSISGTADRSCCYGDDRTDFGWDLKIEASSFEPFLNCKYTSPGLGNTATYGTIRVSPQTQLHLVAGGIYDCGGVKRYVLISADGPRRASG